MNDHSKSRNDVAEPDKQVRGLIEKLEDVDRRITAEHVARRFGELLDDIGAVVARVADVESAEIGWRSGTAAAAAGVTFRQLDYWARTGLVKPSVRAAHGSGSQRLYGFRDILELKVVKRMLDIGVSLQQIRVAVQHVRGRSDADLTQVTLMTDGVNVYECTSASEVSDLLQGGQAMVGIGLGGLWREVGGCLAAMPGTQARQVSVAVKRISSASGSGQGYLVMRRIG